MNTIFRDKDWLFEQYITLGRTIKSIHEECGVSHHTIETYLKKYGIRKTSKTPTMPTMDELVDLHHNQAFGISKIASLYPGVGTGTIARLMERYGIEIIPPATLRKMWWSNPNNKKKMSDIRLQLWQDDEYYKKTSVHLFDERAILDRSIKFSATYQGLSVEDWGGFVTPERTRARQSTEYSRWRTAVFERDGYVCQRCGAKSHAGNPVVLHAHHLENFANNTNLRYDINNGITLCYDCHDVRVDGSFHNIYGVKNNTKAQFEEYMAMVAQ